MLSQWNLDEECQKSIVILLSVRDGKFHAARAEHVAVLGPELKHFFFEKVNYYIYQKILVICKIILPIKATVKFGNNF